MIAEPTPEARTLASLLDVVEELCAGLAAGATPSPEWADVVTTTFRRHRRELAGEAVDWEDE